MSEQKEIKILKTIANQIMIGEVLETTNTFKIYKPYNIIPTQEGLQLFPFDAEIIGKELEQTEIYKSNLIYCTEPGKAVHYDYLNALEYFKTDGIQKEETQLILK